MSKKEQRAEFQGAFFFFLLFLFSYCSIQANPVCAFVSQQINQSLRGDRICLKNTFEPGLCLTPFNTSRAHFLARWGLLEQMSLTGSEGGKGRGSALLMWSVQTIQSVCVWERERGWARTEWQPFRKVRRYDARSCGSINMRRLINNGFLSLLPRTLVPPPPCLMSLYWVKGSEYTLSSCRICVTTSQSLITVY